MIDDVAVNALADECGPLLSISLVDVVPLAAEDVPEARRARLKFLVIARSLGSLCSLAITNRESVAPGTRQIARTNAERGRSISLASTRIPIQCHAASR
jgi:hypothetical protein